MHLNDQKCSRIDNEIKEIFDEVALELADALGELRTIENGVPKQEAKTLARHASDAVYRAGDICVTCGVRAEQILKRHHLNRNRAGQ